MLKLLNSVTDKKQDYLVVPKQHWLDGIATAPGVIKQFVATPMLSPAQQEARRVQQRERELVKGHEPTTRQKDVEIGASIELQVTGYDRTGGLQLAIIPEYDLDRMSFTRTPNCFHKAGQFVSLPSNPTGYRPNLNALRTPNELGLVDGDKIHMKDLDKIDPERPKVLGDLWAEAPDKCRISGRVALNAPVTGFLARLSISCEERQKAAGLEVEVYPRKFHRT